MPTLLDTDGYKFSMAEAGFPLRRETFYYAHRKGGWQYLPFDVEARIRAMLPSLPIAGSDERSLADADWAYLDRHGYFQGGAFRRAIGQRDQVVVDAIPEGSWFFDREPVFSVTGPSAIVSWLEPLALQLHFEIQVATAAKLGRLPDAMTLTCERERELVEEVLERVGRSAKLTVSSSAYYDAVLARARELVGLVGDPERLFEVGMRACSCVEQHEIALRAVKDAGIRRTSNVGLAKKLELVPVGTMGHEHVQRHGSDRAAFTSMRDKFPGFLFYLPDTFDTLASGIPCALEAMREEPERNAGIRFDSEHGIVGHWLYAVSRAREAGLTPLLGLESGWNDLLTRQFEELRVQVGWPADRQGYGYGGYLVNPPWPAFRRDDVSAVWKIGETGGRATMKFGDEPHGGKSSLPGRTALWRPRSFGAEGPVGVVTQHDEAWTPPDADRVTGAPEPLRFPVEQVRSWTGGALTTSPGTRALVDRCVQDRAKHITATLMGRAEWSSW
jgi:nicotinic acid phosphoribosyltransferase